MKAKRKRSLEAAGLLALLWWLWPRDEEIVTWALDFPQDVENPEPGVYTVDPEEVFYAE